jgi:hypothetical protein
MDARQVVEACIVVEALRPTQFVSIADAQLLDAAPVPP